VLTHRVEGREHVYRACVTREQVQRAALESVLDRLFGGSLPALVAHALESREVRSGDAERVREMIRDWQEKGGEK
jgi:predicted transcriptional regulator